MTAPDEEKGYDRIVAHVPFYRSSRIRVHDANAPNHREHSRPHDRGSFELRNQIKLRRKLPSCRYVLMICSVLGLPLISRRVINENITDGILQKADYPRDITQGIIFRTDNVLKGPDLKSVDREDPSHALSPLSLGIENDNSAHASSDATAIADNQINKTLSSNFTSASKSKASRKIEYILNEWGYHPNWHPLKRSERFPSIEQRLRVYMGNWYLPPCDGSGINEIDERLIYSFDYSANITFPDVRLKIPGKGKQPGHSITSQTKDGTNAFVDVTIGTKLGKNISAVWEPNLWNNDTEICSFSRMSTNYCPDIRGIAQVAMRLEDVDCLAELPPIFGVYGDSLGKPLYNLGIPCFQKARYATTVNHLNHVTKEKDLRCAKESGWSRKNLVIPTNYLKEADHKFWYHGIIWPLNYRRHFNKEYFSNVKAFDVSWEEKRDSAVWRGLMTGAKVSIHNGEQSFDEICFHKPRCRFVKKYWNSTLVDVGFSTGRTKKFKIPEHMVKNHMGFKEQLQHKAIIMIEGNDVATGLKWALFSRSVVIMPTPKRTSYCMEEMLEPWVHYVPIEEDDMSDLEGKLKWILDHDKEARMIAERGTLFMLDFLFHKDSAAENKNMKNMILSRYFKFFRTS